MISGSRLVMIGHWLARLLVAGILVMGAIPKLTGGAAPLAERLPGGGFAVALIGVAEIAAVVLIFVPRTTLLGALLAASIMAGAIFSHIAGPVGLEGELGAMFPLAIVAFLGAVASLALGWNRGFRLGAVPGGGAAAAA